MSITCENVKPVSLATELPLRGGWVEMLGRCIGPIRSGYDVVRILMAAVLLTAAVLKAYQLATEPIIGTGLLDSRWLLMATVEFELFFGLWLLANIWAKPTWAAALACFGLFTVVSLCKAHLGSRELWLLWSSAGQSLVHGRA